VDFLCPTEMWVGVLYLDVKATPDTQLVKVSFIVICNNLSSLVALIPVLNN
jgi:hypothetical protein